MLAKQSASLTPSHASTRPSCVARSLASESSKRALLVYSECSGPHSRNDRLGSGDDRAGIGARNEDDRAEDGDGSVGDGRVGRHAPLVTNRLHISVRFKAFGPRFR